MAQGAEWQSRSMQQLRPEMGETGTFDCWRDPRTDDSNIRQTGRVSPRTSSRGGGNDAQSRKSNSPHHSSPLQRETTGERLSNKFFDGANIKTESPGQGDDSETPCAGMAQAHGPGTGNPNLNPPPSQPMLEGGSGTGGAGMEMEAIREERETSA